MKKIAVLAIMLFMLSSFVSLSAQSSIGVIIDGKEVIFTTVAPFVDENNRTLVPLRAIGEAMGLTVSWDNKEQKAIFKRDYTWENSPLYQDLDGDGQHDEYLAYESVWFTIGDNKAIHETAWYDKGTTPKDSCPSSGCLSEISMNTAAIIKDSSTYAPIRYLAEAFRYDVGWNNETRTVILNNMYTVYELGIQTEQVAGWQDSQGWMFTVDENSDIKSIDFLNVTIDLENSEYNILTKEDQNVIYESGENFGKYLNGFMVKKELKVNTYHDYKVKFLVTMKDGTQKFGFADIGYYYDGNQGGYL
ncbi:MAG: uncharacterized protein K0R80_737 [Clostridia bacterium]|nr:uncharacterized protein [Clostridia bacterium]